MDLAAMVIYQRLCSHLDISETGEAANVAQIALCIPLPLEFGNYLYGSSALQGN